MSAFSTRWAEAAQRKQGAQSPALAQEPARQPLPLAQMGQALPTVKRCDFQVARNNQAHHTAAISTQRLVIRRGKPFALTLHFCAPLPGGGSLRELHRTSLVAQTGRRPSQAEGTLVQIPISSLGSWTGWKATLEGRDVLSWSLVVTPPSDATIGHYTLIWKYVSPAGQATQHPLGSFTLLFNPWCRGDSVFLPNEAQRQEYVLNQDGTIYWGLEDAPQDQPWDFGQLSEEMVDISLALLETASLHRLQKQALGCWERGSPLSTCRFLHNLLSSKDAYGGALLEECWTGEHRDGTPPFQWLGSAPILRQWLATRRRPVRYGQGWITAAVTCSVLRSLGIPTRVVSGFSVVPEAAGNLCVEELFDENAALIPSARPEAPIRPFYVWNECWMRRPDLPPGYDGWQAIGATPQGAGSGQSCCGPAPVKAIKEGHLDVSFDVTTFFAATNAMCTTWVHLESGELTQAFSSQKYIGNNISTKGVGSERCEDITHHYKHPEGSAEETAVLEKAWKTLREWPEPSQGGQRSMALPRRMSGDQEAWVEPSLLSAHIHAASSLVLGDDAPLSVAVANWSGQERPLQVQLGAQALQYNGEAQAQFWKKEFQVTVQDGHERILSTTLPYAEYGPALKSSPLLKVTALVRDKHQLSSTSSSAAFLAWRDIYFRAPGLTIQVPESIIQFRPTEAKIQLHNPLPKSLPDCVVLVSGQGLVHKERCYRMGPMEAGTARWLRIPFTPTQAGARRLTVHVESSGLIQPCRSLRTVWVIPPAVQSSSALSHEAD